MRDNDLREYVVSAFEFLKTHYQTQCTVLCDVAALRECLKTDERFALCFEQKRKEAVESTMQEVFGVLRNYDELIQKLKGFRDFVN